VTVATAVKAVVSADVEGGGGVDAVEHPVASTLSESANPTIVECSRIDGSSLLKGGAGAPRLAPPPRLPDIVLVEEVARPLGADLDLASELRSVPSATQRTHVPATVARVPVS
jgi:hypothetical protein